MNNIADSQTFDPLLVCHCTKALISALKHRDVHTLMHSQRVIQLTQQLGQACGLSEKELKIARTAACFHDIGKIGIADEILLKSGRLNEAEWEIMKTHSSIGEDIINGLDMEESEQIARIVRHHHEYYCGKGYPDRLAGEAIPPIARIISITDSYDAMTVVRPYHSKKSHQMTMDIIQKEIEHKFDPYIAKQFIAMIESSEFKAE
jgi:HD-GYP domain-containing protein (c-di-GMP phosphodiesterase class II)